MTAPRKATTARVRRSTPAELAATPVPAEPDAVDGFDPDLDFDMSAWREGKAQVAEATRGDLLFRISDRREDAPADLYEARIPLLTKWLGKTLRQLETGSVVGMIQSLAAAAGDPDLEAVLDELTGDEVGAIIEHLTEASGVTPGESKPSGASSRRTQRR